MALINRSDILAYWENPKRNGFEKVTLIWKSAQGDLLETNQVGATCGIYALHAAAHVLGKHYATPPPKRNNEHKTSIRAEAKRMGLSQVGEINGADDLQKLAASIGIATKILTFRDVDKLWEHIVASADAGDAIVFPYTAVGDEGEVGGIKGPDGFTHWGLLCGYALENRSSRFVFMTTYGKHHMDTVDDLFKSNLAIQDWSAQKWGKIHVWMCEPPKKWHLWQTTWMPDLGMREILKGWVEDCIDQGIGLAIGTKEKPLYILCEPGSMGAKCNPNASVGDFHNHQIRSIHRHALQR